MAPLGLSRGDWRCQFHGLLKDIKEEEFTKPVFLLGRKWCPACLVAMVEKANVHEVTRDG